MDNAFEYALKNKIATESDYPYKAINGQCSSSTHTGVVQVTDYHDVPSSSVAQLKAAIAQGPVSVAIQANKPVFKLYRGGILDSKNCGTNLDHGVAAVGYGDNYFIVRNSWGASWGEDGYVRISTDDETNGGICGILLQASYPETE